MTTSVDMTWRLRGDCYSLHPSLFFSENAEDVEKAKAICNSPCPVKAECREYAKANKEEYGVWAGELMSESGSPLKHGSYTAYVRGCHLKDCAPNDGCLGAKRRYTAEARERAKAKKVKVSK